MNVRDYIRPIIAGLIGLGLIIIVIVLIVRLFTGHGGTPANQTDVGKYADTAATVTLLFDGPTNIDQDHRQLKITVSQTQNEIDTIKGYEGDTIDSRTYPNNSAAFAAFLQSLKQLNFAKGEKSNLDYRGFCPTGDRYVYTFNDGQTDLFSYWSTSCGTQGTFKGEAAAVRQLFERQIPEQDFSQLTNQAQITL